MTDHRSTPPLDADLDWVRRTLAAADPVRPGDRPLVPIPGWSANPPRRERARRRSAPLLVTALAAAAVLIVGVVVVATQAGGKRPGHPTAATGPAPVLAAYATTINAQSARGSLSLSIGPTSLHVGGVADLRTGQADLIVTLPAPIGRAEVRSTGQDYFVHLPAQLAAGARTKPWIRLDQATLQGLVGSQLGVPGVGAALDFSGLLTWLRDVSGHIATIGNESINSTPTTHYRAQVDVARAASNMGADANTASAVAQTLGSTLLVDVWIDAQGRLRQMKATLDLDTLRPPPGVRLPAGLRGRAVLSIDLWNFGVTVHPVRPPANQVSDASSMIGAARGAHRITTWRTLRKRLIHLATAPLAAGFDVASCGTVSKYLAERARRGRSIDGSAVARVDRPAMRQPAGR